MIQVTASSRPLAQSALRLCIGAVLATVSLVGLFDVTLAWQAASVQRHTTDAIRLRELTLAGDIGLAQINQTLVRTPQRDPPTLQSVLQAQLRRFPNCDYLALAQPATGTVVIAARSGTRPPARSLLSEASPTDRDTYLNDKGVDIAWQLPDAPGWWLHAGGTRREPAAGTARFILVIAAILLVWLIGTSALLWRLCRRRLLDRLQAILMAAARAAAGDWRPRLTGGDLDEVGRLASALDGALALVRGQWRHFLWLADEVAQVMPERRAEIDAKRRVLTATTQPAAARDANSDDAA